MLKCLVSLFLFAFNSSDTATAAAAAKRAPEPQEDPLQTLLTNIQQISQSKTRCTNLLQAFVDGNCSILETSSAKEEHVDCYWFLMTTHTIQRMVQYLERNQGDEEVAVVLAALCHALATVCFSDKQKLDRTCQKTGSVRTAIGKAIMCITFGSTSALQNLGLGPGELTETLIRKGVWAAATSLEMVVQHSSPKTTVAASADGGWHFAQHWLLHDAATLDFEQEEGLAAVCEAVSDSLKITQGERACIASLLEQEMPSSPSGKRRRAARANDAPASQIATNFQTLLKNELVTQIDGRVSNRRWASMTFVWFCQGQKRILEFIDSVLEDDKFWNVVLECPAVIGPKDPPAQKSPSSKRTSRKKSAEATTTTPKATPPVHIPGNVSVVALTSRLLNILLEAGTSCGSRAPSGGMDTYAASLLGLTGGKGRGRAAADTVPSSWARPDVRDLASVVIYKLVQSHTTCLRTSCTSPEAFGCVLVNDDTEGFGAAVPNGATRPLQARFYPAVHKSVTALCSAAASSGSDPVGDSHKRLMGLASAFILASGESVRNIVDAKLYGLAVGELAECLRNIVSDDERSSSARAMDMDSEESQQVRHERLKKKYGFDKPLRVPTLTPSSPSKTSRKTKKKKQTENANESTCTFGGTFSKKSTSTEHENITDEEMLSLLICAVQSTSDESPPSAAMFTELIEIIRCCYDLKEPAFEADDSAGDGSSKRKGKKRAATSKSTQGKRKRKKVSAEASEDSSDDSRRAPKLVLQDLCHRCVSKHALTLLFTHSACLSGV